MIDDQHVLGLALDGPGDALPMLLSEDQRAQDEQVEGP
jgi:hypothetical protein